MEDIRAELFALIKARSFRTGRFTLSSGETSEIYFNMKQTMMHPRGAELCARALLHVVRGLRAEYVSGLEMGAVPVIGSMAAISSSEGDPLATTFVRKQAKSHGTKEVIEGLGPGESLNGHRVVVIDDVSTSGKSILQAIEGVRAAGGVVEDAACLVNRAEGGDALLAAHGVMLHAVFSVDEFLA
ncbi:MAG: orotate phosphoribosyltransferase [Sphingomonadaceae bacterium]|nr:orotate phosphoribosyltransferase [Sphingomonadaceae bacterium]